MRITKIVGNPSRFILHENGVFKGEGWLLSLDTVFSSDPSDNIISCSVDLENPLGQHTTVWLVHAPVAGLIKPGKRGFRNFVISAQPKMPDSGEQPLMTVHALMLGDKLTTCYNTSGDALNAANPTNRIRRQLTAKYSLPPASL